MLIALLIILAAVIAAFILDYRISVIGLRKGAALEGNWVVQRLFGTKPNPRQLLIGLLPQELAAIAIGSYLFLAAYGSGAGVFAAIIARHIQNYRGWKKLGA